MTERSPNPEPPPGIRRRIAKVEHHPPVAPILNALPVRRQPNLHRPIRFEQRRFQIVFGQQGPQHRIADVAPESRGRIRVSALAHVVPAQRVVFLELARANRIGAAGHPEAIQVAHAVVGTAALDHGRLVFDRHGTLQLAAKPDGAARGHVQSQHPRIGGHRTWFLRFHTPLHKTVLEIVMEENLLRPRGVIGPGRLCRGRQDHETVPARHVRPHHSSGLLMSPTKIPSFQATITGSCNIVEWCVSFWGCGWEAV